MSRKVFASTETASACAALFPGSVEGIQQIVVDAKARALQALGTVYAAAGLRSFANTAQATDLASAEVGISSGILSVVKNVSPDKKLRDEANKQIVDLQAFVIDQFGANRQLYSAFKEYVSTEEWTRGAAQGGVSGERRYWLEEELKDFKRRGFELPEAQFAEIVALQKELSALSTKFSTNVAEDTTEVRFPLAALAGVPESVVKGLKPAADDPTLLVLKMDYPTYFGVMKNCEVAATRQAMSNAFENRAFPANLDVLKDVITRRHKLATMLGYTSYAHYDLENKMAKTPDTAQRFVDDLIPRLQHKWALEKQVLLRNLHPSVTLTAAGDIPAWDIAFCINNVKKTELNVSETVIQEYFPLDSTVQALFTVYQKFFDITFVTHDNASGLLWHKDTSMLEVRSNRTTTCIGYIVLDLFPREGKFSHACCHSVVPPVLQDDGTFSPALSVVLANFPAATADAPALFLHDDVETFFHEFGHAIHGLMGRTAMATFAGTRVKRDFVELPSQMLEEWLWEPEILQLVTKHYKTGDTLPIALIDAKVASKNAFSGRDSLRQLQFATYALAIFDAPFAAGQGPHGLDTTALFRAVQSPILGGVQYSETAHFECAFGHLMGYAATYYGYMWSEVFAQDVFEFIKAEKGLLSPVLGRRYVDNIIGVGGGDDPNAMLTRFLGRPPNADAFLRKLGV